MADFPIYGIMLLEGMTEAPESGVNRSQMESGPPKQAPRVSRVMIPKPINMEYTAAEYLSFKSWFYSDVAGGADWFSFYDRTDGITKSARIVCKKGQPPFVATPFTRQEGGEINWSVTFTIESWQNGFDSSFDLSFG